MKKKFTLTLELEDDNLTIEGKNDGFNIFELIGFLQLKEQDLIDQFHGKRRDNVTFVRTAKDADGTIMEITKEGGDADSES